MRKKIFNFCLAFVLLIPAMFLLSACNDDKQPSKSPNGTTTEITNVYEDFVFDGNKFVGYVGEDAEIVIPSSYSIHNTNSDVYTMEYTIQDIINYGDTSSLDYEIWAEDLSNFDRYMLVGGMYNVSINGGEKTYVRVGEAEAYFTMVKETYTNLDTIISIELTDYTLTSEDKIDESNLTIISRPFLEMLSGKLESFTLEYNNKVVTFTQENYMQNMGVFEEIYDNGFLTGEIKYDIGNYLKFIPGDDFQVETISSLSPDQALGGGLFDTPALTSITIPASIQTIEDGVFANLTTLGNIVIESAEIYNALTNTSACGAVIAHATTVKVLKTIVDDIANINAYLNTTGGYTKTEEGEYYIYNK